MQPVFVGDVQGCADELEELLGAIRLRFGRDFELWLVGDLINRGPASLRVLRRVRELHEAGRARVVLGNHEIGLLATAVGLRALRPTDTTAQILDAPDADAWIAWLRGLPLVETGVLGETPALMVHAAAHPDWSLDAHVAAAARVGARLAEGDAQRLRAFLERDFAHDAERDALGRLTSCRSVSPDGGWRSEPPVEQHVPWHAAWRERAHAYGVVYGHWALQGLHVAPRLRGLDTGCVHHGRDHDGYLTAWAPDLARGDPFAIPDAPDALLRVRAHARYYVESVENGRNPV